MKKAENSSSVFEKEEIIEMIAEKQQASIKKFFLILCALTFLLQFKKKINSPGGYGNRTHYGIVVQIKDTIRKLTIV